MSNQTSLSACPTSTAVEESVESLSTENSHAPMMSGQVHQEGGQNQNAQPTRPMNTGHVDDSGTRRLASNRELRKLVLTRSLIVLARGISTINLK